MVRRLGAPRWVPEATLDDILCDGTWNRPSVFRVPDSHLWRALYNGVTYENGKRVVLGMMMAESEDGIHWTKPDLSQVVPMENRRLPNQVFMANNGGPAFFDPRDPDPSRRLKFFYSASASFTDKRGQRYLTSADGIHWREAGTWGERPLDAPISLFYNAHRDSYIISNRPINGDRRVAFIETRDFEHFSEPHLVVYPDPEDPPLMQFYGMTVFGYEGMYVGLLLRMHTEPSELHKMHGRMDCALTYSYNGWNFNRAFHQPFIPLNPRGEQGSGVIYPSSLHVDDEHQIRIYSSGSRAGHFHRPEPLDAALMLHTLRLDGFAYLEPESMIGSITTRKLRITGDSLQLNVKAPHGGVRVRILDDKGTPVPGMDYADAVQFEGDELFYTPTWRGGNRLGQLVGREVYLEVEVTHGEIYAIRGDFEVMIGSGVYTTPAV